MLTLLSSLFSDSDLDGAGKPFEFDAEFGAALARCAGPGIRLEGAVDILAQRIEFALQACRHLVAQFLTHAAQLAGDLADHGDAVFLAAHAVDVAGDGLVVLVE